MQKLSGRRQLPHRKCELARGSGGKLFRKNLIFDVAKTAILCIIRLKAWHFPLQTSVKIDLQFIICLKRSWRKTTILTSNSAEQNQFDWRYEPFKPFKKPEAVRHDVSLSSTTLLELPFRSCSSSQRASQP